MELEYDLAPIRAAPGDAFGWTVRTRRIEAGLSQNALARAARIDPAYVWQIERGRHPRPTRPVVLALAKAIGLDARRTDRFLYAAGLAPEVDWQSRAEDLERRVRTAAHALGEP